MCPGIAADQREQGSSTPRTWGAYDHQVSVPRQVNRQRLLALVLRIVLQRQRGGFELGPRMALFRPSAAVPGWGAQPNKQVGHRKLRRQRSGPWTWEALDMESFSCPGSSFDDDLRLR